ncbi:MAG: tetratricopeptide repeat protein, partial [Candidatus Promineifilaceae bacterium]
QTRRGAHELLEGNAGEARRLLQQAVALFTRLGIKREEAWAREELGEACFLLGEWDLALHHYEIAEQLFTEVGETLGLKLLAHHRGHIARAEGRFAAAEQLYAESLQYFYGEKHDRMIARNVAGLGLVAEGNGQPSRAAVLLNSALSLFARLPVFLPPQEMALYEEAAERLSGHQGRSAAPQSVDALVALAL